MAVQEKQSTDTKKEKGNPPVWKRKYWTGSGRIEVAVWKRVQKGDSGEFDAYSATVFKSYKQDGEFKETNNFFAEELPLVAFALQEAASWIFAQLA